MTFGEVGLVVLGVYLLGLVVVAELARRARRDMTPADHFLAGRGLGTFVLFLTLYATAYSGNSLLGFPGEAYRRGFSWVMATGFMLAVVVCFHLLAPRLRPIALAHGFVTPGDWIRHRFRDEGGAGALRLAIAVVMTLSLANYLLAQLTAMGLVAERLTGEAIPYWGGVVGLAGFILFYETLGGMRAVAWTDAVQGLLMGSGLAALLFWLLQDSGGLAAVTQRIAELRPEAVTVPDSRECWNWLSVVTLLGLGSVLYPQLIQRIFAARSARSLRRSFALMSFMPLATVSVTTLIGIAAIPRFEALGVVEADTVLPRVLEAWAATGWYTKGFGALVFVAALAAIMSTADSLLLSMGSILSEDLLGRSGTDPATTRTGKRIAIGVMAVVVIAALLPRFTLWRLIELKMELLVQCFPAFVIALRWPRLRAGPTLAGLLFGAGVTVAGVATGETRVGGVHLGLLGLAGNAAIAALGSLPRASGLRAIACLALALAVLGSAPSARAAPGLETLRRETAAASDAASLLRVVRDFARVTGGFGATTPPRGFELAADVFGTLVTRGRDLGADADGFASLLDAADALRGRITRARERLEDRAGEEDAALERLYRSPDWQRLDYAEVTLGYWAGWAEVSRGQALPTGPARDRSMEAAIESFSRSAVEFGLPRIAMMSLLGLGIARRELGETERARRTLERLDGMLVEEQELASLAAVRFELAVIAFQQGELERARELARRIPPDRLGAAQQSALRRLETEAWIERAVAGQGGGDRAAEQLRALAAEGGEAARFAAERVLRHPELFRDRDVGPAGDWLRAEQAFSEQRHAEAQAFYERALAHDDPLPGVDREVAAYKYALSIARAGGDPERALAVLGELLSDDGGGSVRREAAHLYYSLAEEATTGAPGPRTRQRATRAARLLLSVDPDAPAADAARVRIARAQAGRTGSAGRGGAGRSTSLELLEAVDPASDAYPAALLERARIRAAELQAREGGAGSDGSQARDAARRLLEDLAALEALTREGRLEASAEREIRLEVWGAKAALHAGEPTEAVLARIARVSGRPGLASAERGALLRVELAALGAAQDFQAIARRLASGSDGEVREHWTIWYEALQRIAPHAPARLALALHERLAPLAPRSHRDAAELALAHSLLAAGRGAEAAAKAYALTERLPEWGDAWLLHARALRATGATAEACRRLAEIEERLPDDAAGGLRARVAAERATCPPEETAPVSPGAPE